MQSVDVLMQFFIDYIQNINVYTPKNIFRLFNLLDCMHFTVEDSASLQSQFHYKIELRKLNKLQKFIALQSNRIPLVICICAAVKKINSLRYYLGLCYSLSIL